MGAGAVPRRPHLPPQIRLPRLRNSVSGASARASDRRRPGDAGTARAGPGGKYCDHTPLYRQSQIFARLGVDLDRSTLAGWVGGACWWLDALYERLCTNVFASDHLFADDTPVPVLDPGRGRTKTGRLWHMPATSGRGGLAAPAAIFVFAPDRKSERPAAHLKKFSGILHVDSYAGFARLQAHGDITLAACWVHMRRNFHEFYEATNSPVAAEALRRIGELYTIEERIRGQSPALRLAERRTFSKPLAEKLTIHPVPLPRSTIPGQIDDPSPIVGFVDAAPAQTTAKASASWVYRGYRGLQHLLPTLQEWCCHHPCKARFRPAGSPLPGGIEPSGSR